MMSDSTEKGQIIDVREAGRRGGQSTLQRKGVEFFKEIGKKGGLATAKRYKQLLSEFGKKGGRPELPIMSEDMGAEGQNIRGGCGRS